MYCRILTFCLTEDKYPHYKAMLVMLFEAGITHRSELSQESNAARFMSSIGHTRPSCPRSFPLLTGKWSFLSRPS